MKSFLSAVALAAAIFLPVVPVSASDSYQGGRAWGTGTSNGNYEQALGHATGTQDAIRQRSGSNTTSNSISTTGVANTIINNGDHNSVDGNSLQGTTSQSSLDASGYIAGGDGGAYNPSNK